MLGEHLGLARGRLAEEYFNASLNAAGEHAHGCRDCGSVAHGQPRSWEQGDGKGLGEGLRGFKEGMKGVTDEMNKPADTPAATAPKSGETVNK